MITPRATRFAWTDHAFSSPELEASVAVEARDGSGAVILSKPYDSGKWRANHVPDAEAPLVVMAAQVVAQSLMLEAAADLKAELERATPPPPASVAPAPTAPGG